MSVTTRRHRLLLTIHPFILYLLILPVTCAAAPIEVGPLAAAPKIDADPSDWREVKVNRIPIRKLLPESKIEATEVELRGGYFDDEIFFLIRWRDSEPDLIHKPYVWDAASSRYVTGPYREDRFALQFGISGDFSSNWLSDKNFTADMWHWKASRSNTIGLAHDKFTEVSTTKLMRSARLERANSTPIYVRRTSDSGSEIYTTRRYARFVKKVMPKYIVNANVRGSIADVAAKGVWADGWWTLELRRKLDTGNLDDATFRVGESRRGAVTVFDASENTDHAISETLEFRLY